MSKMIEEILDTLNNISNWEDRDAKVLKSKSKSELNRIFKNYEKMENCDVLTRANIKAIKIKDLA